MPLYKEKALRWKLLEHANDRPTLKKKKGYFDTFRKSEAGNLKIKTKNTYRHLQQCFENQKYITELCKISASYTFRVSHDAQNLTHL